MAARAALLDTLEQSQLLFADGSRRDLNLLLDYRHRLLTSRLMLEASLFRRKAAAVFPP